MRPPDNQRMKTKLRAHRIGPDTIVLTKPVRRPYRCPACRRPLRDWGGYMACFCLYERPFAERPTTPQPTPTP
jgi:hypothetical protein